MISNTNLSIAIVAGSVLAASSAHAISIRDDVPDQSHVVSDSDYPALVDLFEPGDCIGTLIHPSFLLTVAHCAVDLSVGRSLSVGGDAHAVAEVILHSSWQDGDAFDIALVRFESPVTTVDPLPIYRGSSELGSVVTLVGRGVTSTGLEGEVGATSDGKLRLATNIVSATNTHFLEIVFERPGEEGITELEGVGISGDSGCPVFIDVDGVPTIAGLNSYGDAQSDADIGRYGSSDFQSRVSQYLDWIDQHVASSPTDPDPDGDGDGDEDDDGDEEDDDATGAAGCWSAGQGRGSALLVLFVLGALRKQRLAIVRRAGQR